MAGRYKAKRVSVQLSTGEQITTDSAAEARVVSYLDQHVVDFSYHPEPVRYTLHKRWWPDLWIHPMDGSPAFLLEIKGWWEAEKRNAWLHMWNQNRHLDIRLAFCNPHQKTSPGAKGTLGEWADKHGILWCSLKGGQPLPQEWTGIF